MDKRLLDTNVLIRFLRADHPSHFAKATALFQQAESGHLRLVLLESVIAETVWVLTSVYDTPRTAVSEALLSLVQHGGIECPNKNIIVDALSRFHKFNVDFMDCLLAAHAATKGYAITSFDKDFRKFKDVTTHEPGT